jgi:hypothetical protein
VRSVVFLGDAIDCQVLAKSTLLRAKAHPSSSFNVKEKVYFRINSESSICIPSE